MASVGSITAYLLENGYTGPVDFSRDIVMVNYNDGNGNIIQNWNINSVTGPTIEQLSSYTDDQMKAALQQAIINKYDDLLANLSKTDPKSYLIYIAVKKIAAVTGMSSSDWDSLCVEIYTEWAASQV